MDSVLRSIAARLASAPATRPLRVAIDGITAAGKSTFAAALAAAVTEVGRPAVHLSTDDFHHRAERRRRNPDRARGYYDDAYDLVTFRRLVLDPLGPGGDLRYRARLHDLETDEVIDEPPVTAVPELVAVVDGSFLQKPELVAGWDEIIWLDTPFEVALERALLRDDQLFGGPDGVRAAYSSRYHAACRLYLDEVNPRFHAGTVVDGSGRR